MDERDVVLKTIGGHMRELGFSKLEGLRRGGSLGGGRGQRVETVPPKKVEGSRSIELVHEIGEKRS